IATWQIQRQSVLVLAIDPADEARLTLTHLTRWTRGAHRKLGADGLVISSQGLTVGYPTLFYTCSDYWQAWRNGRAMRADPVSLASQPRYAQLSTNRRDDTPHEPPP